MPANDRPLDTSAATPFAHHGGRLSAAREAFPAAPEPWLDLSTGINPHAYPVGELLASAWRRLPDPADEDALEAVARAAYAVPNTVGLVAAPGTQALIQLLPGLLPGGRVAVWRFGYQEHPAVWRAAGATVTEVPALEDLALADVAVVVSPNNPDGERADPDRLATVARTLAARGGTLVVDEAFADVLPREASFVPRMPRSGAIVLRSFGKFFGLAGLRLGFAVGDRTFCQALRAALGSWAVSGPALAIGTRALADRAWQAAMRRHLQADARRLDELLAGAGLTVIGGTPLFRLARHPDASAIFHRLCRAGILTRPFAHDPAWLRFGVPGDEMAWVRLRDAIEG